MDNALAPRDIQARIRSGQSLEEVGRVAGLPLDRVERFAAPVLAEREHVAQLAMSSSVRRRGETSGHRVLRLAVSERLQKRGVDVDAVDWDAYRQSDGRWSVTASYQSGESHRQAQFSFDLQGRFSVAADDEARWLLGEQSSVKGPQPGRRRPVAVESDEDADYEPTLDLNDELALVRVVQSAGEQAQPDADATSERVGQEPGGAGPEVAAEPDTGDDRASESQPGDKPEAQQPAPVRGLHPVPDEEPGREPADQETRDQEARDQLSDQGNGSPLDTLAGMLSSEEEERRAVYGGLSDASAVPETDLRGWEPGLVVDYPVEPSPEPQETAAETPPTNAEPPAAPEASDESPAPSSPSDDTPEPATPRPAGKRKRASVPSWDEIMFGGPPRSS